MWSRLELAALLLLGGIILLVIGSVLATRTPFKRVGYVLCVAGLVGLVGAVVVLL